MTRTSGPLLTLLLAALAVGAALAQEIPPTPLPSVPVPPDVQPLPAPAPPAVLPTAPTPGQPAPGQPAPGQPLAPPTTPPPSSGAPAPVQPQPAPQPATPVTPAPTPVPPPAVPTPSVTPPAPRPSAPLTLRFQAQLRALAQGRETTVPLTLSLTIPAERAAILRAGGKVTASLEADLRMLAGRVPVSARDTRFEEQGGSWQLAERPGFAVDLDASRQALLEALITGSSEADLVYTTLPTPKTVRGLDYFQSRGITAFLATGQTNYYGSSRARITNIHAGTRKFQDRLFEGKTVSFNTLLGPITPATGFVPGLVIAGDRTASGVGGGICQVSTTVFRALYGAGLPILERRNHSYQVHYYDPQGLDATIYQPSQDLRFANDTGGALWFQSSWDDQNAALSVSVFGRPRAATVEIGLPRTLSSAPSPADRLIGDPGLPRGVRKQIDWAARGAIIEVQRRFVQDGKVTKSDTLRSSYRPWPNIFLVGTGK